MDLSKLPSQLVKEAEKSPVKAGALGLLTLVALWFWGPLVWGYFRPADPAAPATPADAASATTPTSAGVAPTPAAAAAVALDWQGLLRARRTDPKMAVAMWDSSTRDPFRDLVKKAAPMVAQPMEVIVEKPTTKSLQELGLVLQGVMVGSKTKSATINGVTLPEGSHFAVDKDGKVHRKVPAETTGPTPLLVEIREVRATEVVLVSEGKEYPLPLRKRSSASGSIEITRSTTGN